eukprot:TRINITY_DN674_c0_g1_i5.p3 TRINITY_DN674_c0_g1~~TRINITY_DN674_c0_g1_i5.p3  ORF type:complete len:156 (+),score=26.46 TRINITY_DN674_c0_g1_i5:1017-1484(+)
MVLYSTSVPAGALSFLSPLYPMFDAPQATELVQDAYTPLSNVYRLLRLGFSGTRGYPLFAGIPTLVQAPVMHSSCKIGKCLVYFMLALVCPSLRLRARTKIYEMLGSSNLGAMDLREFGSLVDIIMSVPGALVDDALVDTGVMAMVRPSQVLTAS